jgi:hypothetical protein
MVLRGSGNRASQSQRLHHELRGRKAEYNFADRLAERGRQLRHAIEAYGTVIWSVIIRKENAQILDRYCWYTTLREMRVSRICAYVGVLSQ